MQAVNSWLVEAVRDAPDRRAQQMGLRRIEERAAGIRDQLKRSSHTTRASPLGVLNRIGQTEQALAPADDGLARDGYDCRQSVRSRLLGPFHDAAYSFGNSPA